MGEINQQIAPGNFFRGGLRIFDRSNDRASSNQGKEDAEKRRQDDHNIEQLFRIGCVKSGFFDQLIIPEIGLLDGTPPVPPQEIKKGCNRSYNPLNFLVIQSVIGGVQFTTERLAIGTNE